MYILSYKGLKSLKKINLRKKNIMDSSLGRNKLILKSNTFCHLIFHQWLKQGCGSGSGLDPD